MTDTDALTRKFSLRFRHKTAQISVTVTVQAATLGEAMAEAETLLDEYGVIPRPVAERWENTQGGERRVA
jgi:hypothetical protein